VRYLLYPIEGTNVVKSINARGEAAVKAEDLVLDEGGKRKEVEEVGEVFPDVCVAVLSQAFVIEAVDLGDLTGFVITSKDGDTLGIADFQGDEKSYCFDGEVSTIDIIT
jgi:hypothetical protein